MDFDLVWRVLREFEGRQVRYVLVGGVALGIHGLLRTTEDVDLFIAPDERNVERVRQALRAIWNDPEIDRITAEDLAGEYPTIRYVPPQGGVVLDLMARLGTAFAFDDLEAETLEVGGVRIQVATPRTLHRMKKGTLRPLDRADAEMLRERFHLEED